LQTGKTTLDCPALLALVRILSLGETRSLWSINLVGVRHVLWVGKRSEATTQATPNKILAFYVKVAGRWKVEGCGSRLWSPLHSLLLLRRHTSRTRNPPRREIGKSDGTDDLSSDVDSSRGQLLIRQVALPWNQGETENTFPKNGGQGGTSPYLRGAVEPSRGGEPPYILYKGQGQKDEDCRLVGGGTVTIGSLLQVLHGKDFWGWSPSEGTS